MLVTFSLLLLQIEMPIQDDFPRSVVLHFPPSVYQQIGAAQMLPKLLEIFHIEDIRCVQFLRNGKARVSFREKEVRDRYLVEGMRFGDHDIPVTSDGQKVTVLYIRDLPYEVPSDDVVDFFSSYGEVLTIERSVAADFPNLCNGNRILKMILNEDLPYFLSVCGCQCRVWYRGQRIQCFVCRELGHRAQSCPLSGRCRYCHQVGHMARDCGRAWDPLPSVEVPVDDDNSSMSDSDTVIEVPVNTPSDPVLPAPAPDPDPPDIPVDPVPADSVKVAIDKDVSMPREPDPDPPDIPVDPVPDKVPVADPVVPVKVSVKPSADKDVSMPRETKTSRTSVTAKVFCARLSKTFNRLPFPNYEVTGKEWDSRAKAHLRVQIRAAFKSKDIDLTNSDLRKWSENDLREVSNIVCEMLSVHNYLVDFVFGIIKSFWNNAKKTKGEST